MNGWDYCALIALPAAIAVNAISVYLQKSRNFYTKKFADHAWLVHRIIISIFWGLAVLAGFGLAYSPWKYSKTNVPLGALLMTVAVVLFVLAIKQIGSQALGNGNFFGQKLRNLGGIYRYLKNPIYLSYAVWYVGLTFVTQKKTFLLMALIVIIGLRVETYVEQPH
ncbi:MAG: hypothetical protein NVS1B7_1220 [Candidatus Saccharimonadales bacterium]